MQRFPLPFTISLVALVLLAADTARADKIDFTWKSSFTPTSIAPDKPTQGAAIQFWSESGTQTSPSGFGHAQYAMGIANQEPPWLTSPTTYTNKPFVMTLKITDGPSGLSDTLTFHGLINGGIVTIGPQLPAGQYAPFSFSDGVQSVTIGHDVYHIAMQSGTIFGGTDPMPNIFAKIDASHISNTPEPSSLLLAAMALPVLGFVQRRRTFSR